MIILTGGIGCGKSVVSQLLRVMGYSVCDCDALARHLMLHDPLLRQQLCEAFGASTYLPDGTLNKPWLSSQIFGSAERLRQMNDIVHPFVARHIQQLHPDFVETAIYFESGFDLRLPADSVWCIAAPLELRISRTMARDSATREQVMARIQSQMSQEEKTSRSTLTLWNDGTHSLIEQTRQALGQN